MTGIELIVGALAAGATAGITGAASAAVQDTYNALRDALRRMLTGRQDAAQTLDVKAAEPEVLHARLGDALVAVGADHDEEVLATAHRLLGLVDPSGTSAGRSTLDLRGASGVQVGDGSVRVDTNYGRDGRHDARCRDNQLWSAAGPPGAAGDGVGSPAPGTHSTDSCRLAGKFERRALDGVRWESADAAAIVNDISTERPVSQRGRSGEMAPLDLAAEPALAQLIEAVDLNELTAS